MKNPEAVGRKVLDWNPQSTRRLGKAKMMDGLWRGIKQRGDSLRLSAMVINRVRALWMLSDLGL